MTIHADKAEVAARLLKLYESTANPQFRRQCLKMITSLTTPTVNSSSSTSAVGGGITRCKTAKGDDRKRSKVSIDLEAQKQSGSRRANYLFTTLISLLIKNIHHCKANYIDCNFDQNKTWSFLNNIFKEKLTITSRQFD